MSDDNKKKIGQIEWHDLTVPDAVGVRDFYKSVIGWDSTAQSMGEYDDFCMQSPGTDETIAGVCHARGPNAALPAQWLMYVRVENVNESIENCQSMGGKLISGPSNFGDQIYCVIQDPAGASVALISDDPDKS